MYKDIVDFIKSLYGNREMVPLHEPRFVGNEKKYLNECIDSTYVSYIGEFVSRFEEMVKSFTGAKHAVATVNGTLALQAALLGAGVTRDDEVLTQAFTFVATVNAIAYCSAHPVFVDCDQDTFGMSPEKLEPFLEKETVIEDGYCRNRKTGRRISACVPVHVFGHPVKIDKIKQLCDMHYISLVEDAAESLGSFYKGRHTGTFGKLGILSFNGNKIITTGGGGMILTDDEQLAKNIRHMTTTAKIPHPWEFIHDMTGYNYRMPNVNAAIGCAQMEELTTFLENKRQLASIYEEFFDGIGIRFFKEGEDCRSNYWLNAIILNDKKQSDQFLDYSNNCI